MDGDSNSLMLTLRVREQLSLAIDAKIYYRQGLVQLALRRLSSALSSFAEAHKLQPLDAAIAKKVVSTKK